MSWKKSPYLFSGSGHTDVNKKLSTVAKFIFYCFAFNYGCDSESVGANNNGSGALNKTPDQEHWMALVTCGNLFT
jgi:hypothetical protein